MSLSSLINRPTQWSFNKLDIETRGEHAFDFFFVQHTEGVLVFSNVLSLSSTNIRAEFNLQSYLPLVIKRSSRISLSDN